MDKQQKDYIVTNIRPLEEKEGFTLISLVYILLIISLILFIGYMMGVNSI